MFLSKINKLSLSSFALATLCLYAAETTTKGSPNLSKGRGSNSEATGKFPATGESPYIKSDADLTTELRTQLMSDDRLSMYSKNISIVSLNGLVTLRGTVDSAEEKAMIEKHARSFVSGSKIRNQIQVTPNGMAR